MSAKITTNPKNDMIMTEEQLIRLACDEKQKLCLGLFKKEEGKSLIMKTIFSELSEEIAAPINFYSLDAEEANTLKQQYSIQILPSFLVFVKGKLVEIYSGLISKTDLKTSILTHFKTDYQVRGE